jgi:hypothetical protein
MSYISRCMDSIAFIFVTFAMEVYFILYKITSEVQFFLLDNNMHGDGLY